MAKFTKKDLFYSVLSGLMTGFIAWKVFDFLNISKIYGVSFAWLVVLVPILWVIGVNLGYFLGRWLAFFNQFGKFVAIGFTNAALDFGILNLLIFLTGITGTIWYSVFKITSAAVSMTNSYILNKNWAFEAGKSGGGGMEFIKFISVSLFSLFINVLMASLVVNFIHPVFGINAKGWANIGAVVGSASGLIFNFVGLKLAVFKKSQN